MIQRAIAAEPDNVAYRDSLGWALYQLGRYDEAVAAFRETLRIDYRDADGRPVSRRVRPLQLQFWGRVWTLTAWCELRDALRIFRIDRIINLNTRVTVADTGQKGILSQIFGNLFNVHSPFGGIHDHILCPRPVQ